MIDYFLYIKWYKRYLKIEIANRLQQKNVFLSFCSSDNDVKLLRQKYDYDMDEVTLESYLWNYNLELICNESDGIIIDPVFMYKVPLEKI